MSKTTTYIYKVYLSKGQLDKLQEIYPKIPGYPEEVCTCLNCDGCGKKIPDGTKYIRTFSGHHAWGNDSVDSHEYHDYCSLECAQQQFDEFKKLIESGENSKTDFCEYSCETAHYSELGDD